MISESATFPGCMVDCRIIGALEVEQTECNGDTMRNDRFIAMPGVSQLLGKAQALGDLPEGIIDELEAFFKNYNEQAGKKFKVTKRLSAHAAAKLLKG